MNISLTTKEKEIFNLLRSVLSEKTPETIIRAAGGWVRDKLLSKNSNDIDISPDNMSGKEFAFVVKEYMDERGIKCGKVTILDEKPDQAKTVETAMLKIFGYPIDFVQLRKEKYNQESRTPEVLPATAKEDALRRDLTINALFYNINSEKIEDFAGGIKDLELKIARTPIDPIQTFLEDPLRILRVVRFCSKYNLTPETELIRAANNPEVKKSFDTKITQERIWSELGLKETKGGAFAGPDPAKAAILLKELGFMEKIFDPTTKEMLELNLTEEMVPWETDQNNPHHKFDIWNHTIKVLYHLVNRTNNSIKEDTETYLVRNLSALLHDIGKRYVGIQGVHKQGHTTYKGHEDTSSEIAKIVLDRLSAPKRITKRASALIENHLRPHVLTENGSPKALRRFVKDFLDWPHCIDLAIADALAKDDFNEEEESNIIKTYDDLTNKIKIAMKNIPEGKTEIPLPISGNDLLKIGFKTGPIIGKALKAVRDAVENNPDLTKQEGLEIAKIFII